VEFNLDYSENTMKEAIQFEKAMNVNAIVFVLLLAFCDA
jgi:hypothetical protein